MRSTERIEFLKDVLITAVESGVGYWANVSLYNPHQGTVTLTELDGSGNETEIHEVTLDTVAIGIARLKSKDFQVCKEIRRYVLAADAEDDASDIDSPAADVIVQAGLFGEIVYG